MMIYITCFDTNHYVHHSFSASWANTWSRRPVLYLATHCFSLVACSSGHHGDAYTLSSLLIALHCMHGNILLAYPTAPFGVLSWLAKYTSLLISIACVVATTATRHCSVSLIVTRRRPARNSTKSDWVLPTFAPRESVLLLHLSYETTIHPDCGK